MIRLFLGAVIALTLAGCVATAVGVGVGGGILGAHYFEHHKVVKK